MLEDDARWQATVMAATLACALVGMLQAVAAYAQPIAFFDRPFSSQSVWNIELPSETRFKDLAKPIKLPVGLSSWLRPDGSSFVVAKASQDDPLVPVLYHPNPWPALAGGIWKTFGNPMGIEARIRSEARPDFPYPYHTYVSQSAAELKLPEIYDRLVNPGNGKPVQIRLPSTVRPSLNADGHMAVFQPSGEVFESYATILLSDGTVVAQTYKVTDPASAGDGFQNGITASMIPVYAGLIRRSDLESGRIPHAMKIVVPAGLLSPSFTYPALTFDRGALTEKPPYSGELPMGTRLAIPPTTSLGSLRLKTPLGAMIAEAAATHGLIIVDRGGGGITLITEPELPAEFGWTPEAESDLRRIFAVVRRAEVPAGAYATSRDHLSKK